MDTRRSRTAATLLAAALAVVLVAVAAPPSGAADPVPTPRPPDTRIVGGTAAPVGAWPSVASLVVRGRPAAEAHVCGGTVVDRSWILTAAHCLQHGPDGWDLPAAATEVLVGTVDLGSGGTRLPVAERRLHPGWSAARFRNDIALVRLATPVPSAIPLQALADTASDTGGGVTSVGVAGWGVTSGSATTLPRRLREATMLTAPSSWCGGYSSVWDSTTQLCTAGTAGPVGTCFGDSGGPVATGAPPDRVQVGIASYVLVCGDLPSYFTRVAPFRSWIDSHVRYGPHAGAGPFARSAYLDVLGRVPSNSELFYGAAALEAGTTPAAFVEGLLDTSAFATRTGGVIRLYRSVFLRAPDSGGLAYWRDQANRGMSLARIAELMVRAPEFTTLYGRLADDAFVRRVYENVLGRAPAASEVGYWVGELGSGRRTRGAVMVGFSESPENRAATAAETALVGAFGALIRRVPSAAERSRWLGAPPSELLGFLLGSYAYAVRH